MVDAVGRHLETDPTFVDLLIRGLLSLRRSARWLVDFYGWDATEEAVVSALRKYRDDGDRPSLWDARPDIQNTQIDIISGLALVTVPGVPEVRDEALGARMGTHKARTLTVLQGRRVTRLLVEAHSVEAIRKAVGEWGVEDVTEPVHGLRLVFPDSGSHSELMVQVLSALAHHEIDILETMSCSPDLLVVVHSDDITDAFHVVSDLCRDEPLFPGGEPRDTHDAKDELGLGNPDGRPAFP